MRDSRRAEAVFSPGEWLALATGTAWLLAEVDPSAPVVAMWWDAIYGGASTDEILGLVMEEGFRSVPSFAVFTYDADAGSGSVVVRGDARVSVAFASGDVIEVHGDGAPTWVREDLVDPLLSVAMAAPDAERTIRLPLAAGTTVASRLEIAFESRGEGGPSTKPSPPPLVKQPARVNEIKSASIPVVPPAAGGDELPSDASPSGALGPRAHEVQLGAHGEDLSSHDAPLFDHLFGATKTRPEDQLAAAGNALDVEPTSGGGIEDRVESRTLVPTDTMPEPPDVAEARVVEATPFPPLDGIISAVPWATDGSGVPLPAPVGAGSPALPSMTPRPREVSSSPSPAAEVTVNRAALLAAAGESPVTTGPTVKAIRCPAGHLSPPTAVVCRVCGSEIANQDTFSAPRPLLGSIRLSTGDVIPLDRGIVLGRAPEFDGEGDRPNLVKLASPENDISRTHLSVRLDEWHVLVVDNDSTNGTVATLPGQPPQKLRPHDPLAIEPGTVVSLADEITFVYEIPS